MRRQILLRTAVTVALIALASPALAQPVTQLDPGAFVFHLHGSFQFSIGGFESSLNNVTSPTGTSTLSPFLAVPELHLRPGFDGQTLSGIEYGTQAEFLSPYSEEGGGKSGKFGASESSVHVVDVNRAYGYVGLPNAGFIRVGKTDSAFTLLQSGVIEAFGDGGQWTLQGGAASLLPREAAPTSTIIYADQPAVYSTFKIVYISPSFQGLKFSAGFEPNSDGIKQGYSPTNAQAPSAAYLYPISEGNVGYERKNTIDAAAEYTLTSGAIVYKTSAGVLYGSSVQYEADPLAAGTPTRLRYDALEVYELGGQATYAGLTLGVSLKAGQVEDGYALKPEGTRNALTYIIGATYQIGPVVVGTSYFNAQSAGDSVPGGSLPIARTLSEYGSAVGANYILTDHVNLFTQYLYGHRHQPGNISLIAGNAQVQAMVVGVTATW
jgi:hypothetical protein